MAKITLTIGISSAAVGIGALAWMSGNGAAHPPATGDTLPMEVAGLNAGDSPSAENTTAPVATTASPRSTKQGAITGAVYAIQDPEGGALAGARYALCANGAVLISGSADTNGEFGTEEDLAEDAELLVLAEGWAPQVHTVSLSAELHEVCLTAGDVVSGVIVVDGNVPGENLALRLRSDDGYVNVAEELGIDRKLLGYAWDPHLGAWAKALHDGSFRFQGLPAGWSGELSLTSEFRLADQLEATSDSRVKAVHLERAQEGVRV